MEKITLRTVIIVQARMGSTRLPGKVLKTILQKPMLAYELERLKKCKLAADVVLATSDDPENQKLCSVCQQLSIPHYVGSEDDVLGRYLMAAKEAQADLIVRVTGDCPLIDSQIVDAVIAFFLKEPHRFDYVSNTLKRTFPRGMDVEVFSRKALEKAAREANLPSEREHVTPYMYQHPNLFNIGSFESSPDHSQLRLTVDTLEDFELIEKIITALYPHNKNFRYADILNVLKQNPEWKEINQHIKQKHI